MFCYKFIILKMMVGVCVWMECVGVFPYVQAVECISFASQLTTAEMKKACLMALDAAMVK